MIVLASTSKTRAKILKASNIDFIQRDSEFNEDSITTNNPVDFIYQVAKGKLNSYQNKYKDDLPFLVADTVVVVNSTILKKAKNQAEARDMLKMQSGNQIDIFTCMFFKSQNIEFNNISKTEYIFEHFDKKDTMLYLDSGEWKGKAGACMIEGFCKPYIKESNGFKSTAMGLSIEKLLPFLTFCFNK